VGDGDNPYKKEFVQTYPKGPQTSIMIWAPQPWKAQGRIRRDDSSQVIVECVDEEETKDKVWRGGGLPRNKQLWVKAKELELMAVLSNECDLGLKELQSDRETWHGLAAGHPALIHSI
jgi:hypothetical protein